MPKRSRDETEEDRWLRKMKKYEKKLNAKRGNASQGWQLYSEDDESDVQLEEHPNYDMSPFVESPALPQDGLEDDIPTNANPVADDTTANAAAAAAAVTDPASSAQCSEATNDVSTAEIFDPDLLRELGEIQTEPLEFGEDLQIDVAARFQSILLNGLKKEDKEALLKKYLFPKNVPMAKGPTLNLEVGAMLVENCRQRDQRLLTKQDQLGKALSALGKALSNLLKKSPDIPEVIRTLNDAGKLLADSHFAETDTRRSVILPLIDKSLSDSFKNRKRDNLLFGEKLGELVKDSRSIKKTSQLIQAPTSSRNHLNLKGSSSRTRLQRSGQNFYHRAGGPKQTTYQYANRRRAPAHAPPPAPLPARRPPGPTPPQPPRRQPAAPHRASNNRAT